MAFRRRYRGQANAFPKPCGGGIFLQANQTAYRARGSMTGFTRAISSLGVMGANDQMPPAIPHSPQKKVMRPG